MLDGVGVCGYEGTAGVPASAAAAAGPSLDVRRPHCAALHPWRMQHLWLRTLEAMV